MKKLTTIIIGIAAFFTACTNDGYETGDGKYSYLTTELVEVFTNSQAILTHAIDDNNKTLQFKTPGSYSWAATADSTYRAILYYQAIGTEDAVDIYSISPVMVLRPRSTSEVSQIYTDPLFLQSAWISKNRKYLNIRIGVKSGTADGQDENLKQSIGILCDEITTTGSGNKCYHFRIYHNQNGVPEYYTNWLYVSVPLSEIGVNDEIELVANTYQGEQTIKR